MIKSFLSIVILVMLFGCSHTAMYVPKLEQEPHGYSEVKTDEDSYLVTYETYKPIKVEEASNFVLTRSAELAKANGFNSFVVVSSNEETVTEIIEIPEVIGVISNMGKTWALQNYGWQQRGVIAPAHIKIDTIKKSHANIEFSNSHLGENVYLVNAFIE